MRVGKMLPVDHRDDPVDHAAARCVTCGWVNELVLRGDVFVCRDPAACEAARKGAA